MAAGHNFILDLMTVLGASALGGYLAKQLRQPVLLGYLASGLVVGPFGLKLLSEANQIEALAEIGVALLLFALGVEFSIAEFKRVKDIALKGSLLQIGLTIVLVTLLATLTGWVEGLTQGIFLGAILSLSSTAVVLKSLTERGETNTLHGQVMLAILIAQDLALGLMLAILPTLDQPTNIGGALAGALLKVLLFGVAAVAAGRWLVPRVIESVAKTESSELFLLTVIALCLGVALITDRLGLSIEMGAFVAGLMISEIDYADQALAKILPLRDTFASLFFASIGMLIDPLTILQNFSLILGLVTVVMLGKATIILPIVLKFGYSFKTAFITSFGLNQIGEFSFVLALVAFNEGLIEREKYLLLLGTTAITLVLTPVWLKFSPRLADELTNLPGLRNYLRRFRETKALSIPETICDHVVVAGYGRVGQVVVNILQNQGYAVLVIDNSEAAIQRLRTQRIPYLFGDADSEMVLEKAHLEKAKALAIALPDPVSTRLLLKRALEFAPELDVVVRCHHNNEIDVLTQLGAQEVVQPEFEAALEIGSHLLTTLGENPSLTQSVINAIRANRYLSIRPERATSVLQHDLNQTASEFHRDWLTVETDSPLQGITLAAADIRNLTGVTVMAIQRDGQTLYYPKPQTVVNVGDRLLVVGEPEELVAFRDLMTDRARVGEGCSHWVTLTESSTLAGLHPIDIQHQYHVVIQAVRRQGKLYNAVDDVLELQPKDYLLLRGECDRVEQVAKLAS
ncbi:MULTISPECIES: cation:proton antiporter [unclassified Coleofasciculus]|uniref:cation:proton antiporter domain-containing protein n=1 Tax=unclassified Coleofasciculus TaxID=2692782 RepID=UPI00187E095B|nr:MULTISPECIES: cation:proton antiporter [unclassified Coleofasciculus]MBE9128449.1 cation:proton antiporter [Coleofasciculus sp. LEGE 07081]MBE9148236.1 cation:proton antiporter [Coleofasciculus sp. LEGE 07092]